MGAALPVPYSGASKPVKWPGRQPVMQLCDLAGIIGHVAVLISDLHMRNNCYEL